MLLFVIQIKSEYYYIDNMKLRYFSDLHLEFIKPTQIQHFIKKIPSGHDKICILAGDIGNPHQSNYDTFMKFISKNCFIFLLIFQVMFFLKT